MNGRKTHFGWSTESKSSWRCSLKRAAEQKWTVRAKRNKVVFILSGLLAVVAERELQLLHKDPEKYMRFLFADKLIRIPKGRGCKNEKTKNKMFFEKKA